MPSWRSPASADGRFTDDDGNVDESAIEAIADAGITVGGNPPEIDRFCPDDPVTRAEIKSPPTRARRVDSAHFLN